MDPVIIAQGLTRRFGDKVAVNSLDLSIERGQVFGFLGPNGAGKTTTVRLLNGLLTPDAGSARVLGMDVSREAQQIRRQTGVLTESSVLYEALTARENLQVFGDLFGVPEDKLPKRVQDVLKEFDLAERQDDKVGAFSKGMKQRLAIARALLHEPALLFLDEPTSGLDPAAARMVTGMIQQLSRAEGRTIFMCTHNLAEAQRLCDQVGIIDRGVLKAIGTPRELARQLFRGIQVEVDLRGEPSAAITSALGALPVVRSHAMEDGKLLLKVDLEESIPDVVATIAAAGGRIFGVVPREPTLEDVYFEVQANDRALKGGAA
jgi:ABC-2 type transport system ATP-binding protein